MHAARATPSGKVVEELAKSDLSEVRQARPEARSSCFTFKAGDGETDLYGMLHFPSNFDPTKKYPLLVSRLRRPGDQRRARERSRLPSALTEYGFLVRLARLAQRRPAAARSSSTRSTRSSASPEIDDQAAGVKSLWDRPYVDKNRVGIFGTSLRRLRLASCACCGTPTCSRPRAPRSPVTDWRHYDTIYTERYMWTPQENKDGYDAGSAMTYADKLKGRLMLFYGTADNNVHPNNTLQLIQALQRRRQELRRAGRPRPGPLGDLEPSAMMEFFIENLVMKRGDS